MNNDILDKINSIAPPGWRHKIDVGQGVVTPGREDSSKEMNRLHIDTDLSDKRVLDIGCSDGYFSFACEQRGAEVTAIDNFTSTPSQGGVNGFAIAADLLNSKATLINMSVYDIEELDGMYDTVLLINVLYHLRHPALAIDKIYSKLVPGGKLHIKSHFHQDFRLGSLGFDFNRKPIAKFYEGSELNNDPSNWWGLNRLCIEAMLRSAGFKNIKKTAQFRDRIYYTVTKG
jgi:tRNA (mo5U34)-methyltransferase